MTVKPRGRPRKWTFAETLPICLAINDWRAKGKKVTEACRAFANSPEGRKLGLSHDSIRQRYYDALDDIEEDKRKRKQDLDRLKLTTHDALVAALCGWSLEQYAEIKHRPPPDQSGLPLFYLPLINAPDFTLPAPVRAVAKFQRKYRYRKSVVAK